MNCWAMQMRRRCPCAVFVAVTTLFSHSLPLYPSPLSTAILISSWHWQTECCGFTLESQEEKDGGRSKNEEVGDDNWSHATVLEFFKVVADFLKWEERRGVVYLENTVRRTGSATWQLLARGELTWWEDRQHTHELSTHSKEENFTWKGSSTHWGRGGG